MMPWLHSSRLIPFLTLFIKTPFWIYKWRCGCCKHPNITTLLMQRVLLLLRIDELLGLPSEHGFLRVIVFSIAANQLWAFLTEKIWIRVWIELLNSFFRGITISSIKVYVMVLSIRVFSIWSKSIIDDIIVIRFINVFVLCHSVY